MNFKIWIKNEAEEASLGAGIPETLPPMVNKGSDTPASDEVKRTGLQPQVDAPNSKTDKEKDAVSALDSEIAHLDNNLPEEDGDTPKINKFKQLWNQLKQNWENIKMSEAEPAPDQNGLGNTTDDKFTSTMRQFPNMMPMSPQSQGQGGPGTFGLS